MDPGTEDSLYLKVKMMWARPSVTNEAADCAVSACGPFLLSVKALAPLTARGGTLG